MSEGRSPEEGRRCSRSVQTREQESCSETKEGETHVATVSGATGSETKKKGRVAARAGLALGWVERKQGTGWAAGRRRWAGSGREMGQKNGRFGPEANPRF